jgi:hypothetical protein
MAPLHPVFRVLVAFVCGYETYAIVTKRVPTVSHLCKQHPWLSPIIIGGLTAHLYKRDPVDE